MVAPAPLVVNPIVVNPEIALRLRFAWGFHLRRYRHLGGAWDVLSQFYQYRAYIRSR